MKNIKLEIELIFIENEIPADDLRVFIVDQNGFIQSGSRDEFGYTDDYCNEILNPIAWFYIPEIPVNFQDGIITSVEALNALVLSIKPNLV